jgi:ribosome-associated protein
LDKKAENVVVFDVHERCSYADAFVLASARSARQVQAICAHIETQMRVRFGEKPLGEEGRQEGHWALLDYGDIVVHIFHAPTRELYDLDGLWSDAPRRRVD